MDRRRSWQRPRVPRDHDRRRSAVPVRRAQRDDPRLARDGRDERFRQIDIHATALAGLAVILAIIVAFIVELARGHSGAPYGWLGAIGGVTYIAAVIVFTIRG